MPEPYYLHLSKRQYMERWQEFKEFFQDDELEVIQRPMRDALRRFLQGKRREKEGKGGTLPIFPASVKAAVRGLLGTLPVFLIPVGDYWGRFPCFSYLSRPGGLRYPLQGC